MAEPRFVIEDRGEYRLVRFEIPGGVCSPQEFAEAVAAVGGRLAGDKVVLLNGRGPIWGYGMLVHAAHATKAVATFDPRHGGYVVVASHDTRYALGSVIGEPG